MLSANITVHYRLKSWLCLIDSYDEKTNTMDSGFPRSIEMHFPGMADEVDAALYKHGISQSLISIIFFCSFRCICFEYIINSSL